MCVCEGYVPCGVRYCVITPQGPIPLLTTTLKIEKIGFYSAREEQLFYTSIHFISRERTKMKRDITVQQLSLRKLHKNEKQQLNDYKTYLRAV